MKKYLLVFSCVLLMSLATPAQGTADINQGNTISSVNRTTSLRFVLPDNGGTSSSSRAPQGATRFIRTVYLVTPSEMSASGLPSAKVLNAIGFNYSTPQNLATTGTFKVYLQNTSDATYSKPSSAWTNAAANGIIDNMTLASDGSTTIPATGGVFDIPFTGGTPFTYTGGGVYIAFEYQNAMGPISTPNIALCTTTLPDGLRNIFSATAMGNDLTNISAFRPSTRLGFALANDAILSDVYTLGKIPLTSGAGHVITARITNGGDNPIVNRSITLTISGANTFLNVKTIGSLAPGANTIVTFDPFTPSVTGNNIVTITTPTDDLDANNSKAYTQVVTTNTFSYTDNTLIVPGSVGFNRGSGLLLNKYHITGTANVHTINVFIAPASPTTTPAGKTVYAVVADATGVIIGQSPEYVIEAADLNSYKTFTITIPPSINNADFYAGLAQTADSAGYYPVGYQVEAIPTRPEAYHSALLAGGPTAQINNIGRFLIEAVVSVPLPLTFLQFNAANVLKDVKLNWSTINESNMGFFVVERSPNGVNYEKTGIVNFQTTLRNGIHNYEFSDVNVAALNNPVLYYRLKQVDKDGRFTYSSIVSVKNSPVNEFSFRANYVTKGVIRINLDLSRAGRVTAIITNLKGEHVYHQSVNGVAGSSAITLKDLDSAPTGTYIITLFSGIEKRSQKIFIP